MIMARDEIIQINMGRDRIGKIPSKNDVQSWI